ncbi:hypothetical protein [Iodobacter fluviatilis]|uniref:Uncharacterized protein n=1 Tax=Iodobacter fluviatilis TaxID=537 RepID=A0A7G3GBA7_9NEIS|nr:hypothetical protein [Iodobacter fluviatilis]QBC44458.1 hypothetical protein C1H71_13570 [Iodobacter fluviatilis]
MAKKVQIVEPCLIDGQHHEAGEVLELDDAVARLLTACARVREFVEDEERSEAEPEASKPITLKVRSQE